VPDIDPMQILPSAQSIAAEINRLGEEQNEARRKAAFGGMTEEEALDYKKRATSIRKLVEDLAAITSPRAA
jgi:hypothetical protein